MHPKKYIGVAAIARAKVLLPAAAGDPRAINLPHRLGIAIALNENKSRMQRQKEASRLYTGVGAVAHPTPAYRTLAADINWRVVAD